jgi:predicted permease
MLGNTTATVAIFMLGVFLYGRKYTKKMTAFKLSLLRIAFLPLVALLTTSLFHLHALQKSVLVLMHSMPVAISMIVLSERYAFFQDIVPSLILFSSIGGTIMLNLWLLILSIFTS